MKNNRVMIFIFILALILSNSAGLLFYPFDSAQAEAAPNFLPGELLIKFKNNPEIYRLRLSEEADIKEVIAEYKNNSTLEFIEPNYKFEAVAFPNDPDFIRQPYLNIIKAKDLWSGELLVREQELINRRSVIAILDTGVDLAHPDLKDKIWSNIKEKANDGIDNDQNGFIDDVNGWNFVEGNSDPNPNFEGGYNVDAIKHGTIVAGIAAASTNNQQGISGVGWFSQIMPLRVLDSNGSGDVYSVVLAINYAVDNGANVINMSFVGSGFSQILFDAIQHAYNSGVFVVAAAGNTDPKVNGINLDIQKSYPVCYDSTENMVVGVASVSNGFKKSSFSSYGSCVDLAAPGEGFYSTQIYKAGDSNFDRYYNGFWSGTSLSVPLVSGTLAEIKALRPGFTNKEIMEFLFKSARNIDSYNPDYANKLGSGLLDAGAALELALGQPLSTERGGQGNSLIVGLGFGSFPQIKVLNIDGTVFKEFFAYTLNFKGPINVAAGDLDGSGKQEIVTGAGQGGGPHVRVFNIEGQPQAEFFAYESWNRGGVNLAVGDVLGDQAAEIVTGPGKGAKPEVKIFNKQGKLLKKFMAYDEKSVIGVKVAVGDVNGDRKNEVIASSGPQVKTFDNNGRLIAEFYAFNPSLKNATVNIAVGDINGDRMDEIIVGLEQNSFPIVQIFNYTGFALNNFFAYEPDVIQGMYISTGDFNNDGLKEIAVTGGPGSKVPIKIFSGQGVIRFQIPIRQSNYLGGARTSILMR
jgi:subtilisin family serine protease